MRCILDFIILGLEQKLALDVSELPEVMKTLHHRGVKGFITFNTLVFDHELLEAEKAIINVAEAGADAIIVQDVAIAKLAKQTTPNLEVHGSTQMSITSAQGAELAKSLGCSRVVLGRELSLLAIERIAKATDVELEVIAYQHLPVFHTEHCVFCRFLFTGTDYTNCGHPCESHRIALKDKQGREHPVMADVACRNTVFGAEAQTGAKHLELWLEAGLRDFRIEFVHETALQVQDVIQAFQQVISGQKTCGWLEQQLRKISPTGTTEGSLFVPEDFSHLPQLL
jgi:U32 family peptidase